MVYMSRYTKVIILSILSIIAQIESGDDSSKIGDNGKAIGHLQIHKECVEDVNRWFGTNYCHEDMVDRDKAEDVFFKYIAIGEDLFIKKHSSFPDEEDIVRMWNGGCYSGYSRKSTKKYYEIYQQEKEKRQESQL